MSDVLNLYGMGLDDPGFRSIPVDPIYNQRARHKVFVYGTMKRGFRNHARITDSPNTKFLGEDSTTPHFDLQTKVTRDGYLAPVMFRGGPFWVRGEIYEIDGPTLHLVDLCEGHPHVYRRELIRTMLQPEPVVAYMYPRPFRGLKYAIVIHEGSASFAFPKGDEE